MIITDVIVQREAAYPFKHEDVYDPLIQGESCAVSRGRAVLDEEGVGNQVVSFDIPFTKELKLGQIVDVDDLALGHRWRGKIIGIAHKVQISSNTSLFLTTSLRVKKPTDYYVTVP